MMPRLMIYAFVVGAALAASGVLLERAAALWRMPRRWIWSMLLAASLMLPAARVWRPDLTPSPQTTSALMATRVFRAVAAATSSISVPEPAPMLDDSILLRVWVGGTAALLVLYLGAQCALLLRRRRWIAADLCGVKVLVSDCDGPALIGLWRPAIVIPRWAMNCGAQSISLMLRHEREHLRARDPMLIHLAAVAVLAMPWNPAVWWMASRLKLAVELDCDSRVMRAAIGATERDDAGAYGELLLTVAARRSRSAVVTLAMIERSSSLARRIAAMYPNPFRFPRLRVAVSSATATGLLAVAALVPGPEVRARATESLVARADTMTEQATPAPEDQVIYEPGGAVSWPKPIKTVDPQYTDAAKQAGIQGVVRLRAVVEPDGHVDRIRVTKSLDSVYGLDQAAIEAASRWKFSPATKDGKPVRVWIEMELEFRLH